MVLNRKNTVAAAALLLWISQVAAQNNIPVGQWRTHFSYGQSVGVVVLHNKVYSNAFHSLLEADLSGNSLTKITLANGISDVGITTLATHAESGSLLLGYANGNIDVIRGSTTYNVNSLLKAPIAFSKRINTLIPAGASLFAGTPFGMIELDLKTLEARNTFQELGRNGTTIGVLDGDVRGDSLYLATTAGILSAPLHSGLNLLNFRNWQRKLEAYGKIDLIESEGEQMYAATRSGKLWQNSGSGWSELSVAVKPAFLGLQGNILLYGSGNQLVKRTAEGQESVITLPSGTSIMGQAPAGNDLWIADNSNGLMLLQENGAFTELQANGPLEKDIYRLSSHKNRVFTLGGGLEPGELLPYGRPASVSEFTSNGWKAPFAPALSLYSDALQVQEGGGEDYVLLYRKGIYRAGPGQLIDHTTPGSLISADSGFVPVTSFVINQHNDLIISSNQAKDKYIRMLANGSWEALSFIPASVPAAVGLYQSGQGDYWAILPHFPSAGVLVFNIETKSYRLLKSALPSPKVYDIDFDRDDYGWISTSAGLAIITDTYSLFDSEEVQVTYPIAENSFVFKGEQVNTVAVDGANRKWVGTEKGLYLIDEFGNGSLQHFNTNNTPLPANEILQLQINHATGELFILTAAGLVSYRTAATQPPPAVSKVKVYPNPVLPGFTGLVAIEGLAFDSVVKITDQAGDLVKEVVSTGGTATWNLSDYRGARVTSGIYLIFASTRSGGQSVVGKVAVIN